MGTHPIFESDFDCLTEKMADESVPVPETEPLNLHEDLKKLEDEINTLKQVLGSKEQQAAELRKKLGITPMQQLQSKLDAFGKSETVQKTSKAQRGRRRNWQGAERFWPDDWLQILRNEIIPIVPIF